MSEWVVRADRDFQVLPRDSTNQPAGLFYVHPTWGHLSVDEEPYIPTTGGTSEMVVVRKTLDHVWSEEEQRSFGEAFLNTEKPMYIFNNPKNGAEVQFDVSAERVEGNMLELILKMTVNDARSLRGEEPIQAPVVFYRYDQAEI